ncbi:MAG: ArsR/SmtB family transcription factor [Vulcanimicrobiaceae bacterium]
MLVPVKNQHCRPTKVPKRDYAQHAEIFKALADAHRLKVFATIANADEEVCVCDLTATLPLLQPTVSHHLRVLKEAGLIVGERRGTWVYYRLAPGALDLLRDVIEDIAPGLLTRRALRKTG